MKLRLKGQHHRDVSEVARVLQTVSNHDADLRHKLPRPLKKTISLGCDLSKQFSELVIEVCFEQKEGLTGRHVVETLQRKYGVDPEPFREINEKLGGYFYGVGTRAFIFYDTQYGEGFERFTVAHEAGHLFLEFVPLVVAAQQGSLFGPPSKPAICAARDTPGELIGGHDSFSESNTSLLKEHQRRKSNLREIKANGFAAELLAPFHAVQSVVNQHPDKNHEHYVALLQQTFTLSRTAARVRLAELADGPHPDQEILQLLG